MFCEKCGKKNEDGKRFCQYCGAPLSSGAEGGYTPLAAGRPGDRQTGPGNTGRRTGGGDTRRRKKASGTFQMKPVHWMVLIEGVLLAALLIGGFMLGKYLYGPEKLVKDYAQAGLEGRWDEAYGYLDLDSDGLSKAQYLNSRAAREDQDYTDLTVREKSGKVDKEIRQLAASGDSSEDFVNYEVRCKVEGETQKSTVVAVRTGYRKFFLFDEWKIVPAGLYGENISVTVPAESELLLNGQTPDMKEADAEDGTFYSVYEIPALFYGTYQVEIRQEGMETYRKLVDYQGNSDAFDFYNVYLMPDRETMGALTEQFAADYGALLDSALKGQDFDTVSSYFTETALEDGAAEENYNNLKDSAYSSKKEYGITRCELSNISIEFVSPADSYVSEPGDVILRIHGDMTAYYTYDGETEEEETGNDTWDIRYHLENGVWKLQELS